MTIRYKLIDLKENIVFSSLTTNDIDKTQDIISSSVLLDGGKVRAGRLKRVGLGEVVAITSNPDFLASSKIFKSSVECILNSLQYLKNSIEEQREVNQKNMQRLIHNLTTLNGHNIQEVYAVIPQEELSNRNKGHMEYVASIINDDPKEAALALLRIAKNNAAIRTEITVFKNLMNHSPKLDPKQHGVHKVVMNILYLFFPDFTDKNILINLTPSTLSAFFDYASLHVALYHLLDNAAKYAAPSQTINSMIEKLGGCIRITFEMISLKIADDEVDSIFIEGTSGKFPKALGKAGAGVGMGLISSIIKLNDGRFFFERKSGGERTIIGLPYQCNIFAIELPATKLNRVAGDF